MLRATIVLKSGLPACIETFVKHVTIIEIHMLILDICVVIEKKSHNVFKNQNSECLIC